jgi:hypothetical protein
MKNIYRTALAFFIAAGFISPLAAEDIHTGAIRFLINGSESLIVSDPGGKVVLNLSLHSNAVTNEVYFDPKKGKTNLVYSDDVVFPTHFVLDGLSNGDYRVTLHFRTVRIDSNELYMASMKKLGRHASPDETETAMKAGGAAVAATNMDFTMRVQNGLEIPFVCENGNRWIISRPNQLYHWDDYVIGANPVNDPLAGWKAGSSPAADALLSDGKPGKGFDREAFLKAVVAVTNTPLYDPDRVTFVFKNKATNMPPYFSIGGVRFYPMARVRGSDWCVMSMKVPADGVFEYNFTPYDPASHRVSWYTDPKNPVVKNTKDLGMGNGLVVMPGAYDRFTNVFPESAYRLGMTSDEPTNLDEKVFDSPNAGVKKVWIWKPASYAKNPDKHYPVIYAMDGGMFHTFPIDRILERMSALADREFLFVMIETCSNRGYEIAPSLALFKNDFGRDYTDITNRIAKKQLPECWTNLPDGYNRFVAEELVPWVDHSYRTLAAPASRVIYGQSYSGQKAFYIASRYPSLFGKVFSHSGVPRFMREMFDGLDRLPFDACISVGTWDIPWIADAENHAMILSLGKEHWGKTLDINFSGGHNPYDWLLDLERPLRWFFPQPDGKR